MFLSTLLNSWLLFINRGDVNYHIKFIILVLRCYFSSHELAVFYYFGDVIVFKIHLLQKPISSPIQRLFFFKTIVIDVQKQTIVWGCYLRLSFSVLFLIPFNLLSFLLNIMSNIFNLIFLSLYFIFVNFFLFLIKAQDLDCGSFWLS